MNERQIYTQRACGTMLGYIIKDTIFQLSIFPSVQMHKLSGTGNQEHCSSVPGHSKTEIESAFTYVDEKNFWCRAPALDNRQVQSR